MKNRKLTVLSFINLFVSLLAGVSSGFAYSQYTNELSIGAGVLFVWCVSGSLSFGLMAISEAGESKGVGYDDFGIFNEGDVIVIKRQFKKGNFLHLLVEVGGVVTHIRLNAWKNCLPNYKDNFLYRVEDGELVSAHAELEKA